MVFHGISIHILHSFLVAILVQGFKEGLFFRTNSIYPLDFGELFHGSALTSSCGGFGRGGARLGATWGHGGSRSCWNFRPEKKRPPKKGEISENQYFSFFFQGVIFFRFWVNFSGVVCCSMNSGSYITECVGMLHLVRWWLVAFLKNRGSSQFIPLISWNLTKLRDSEDVPIATVPSSVAPNSRSQKKNETASDILNDIIMLETYLVRFPIWWKIWFQVLTFWPKILTYIFCVLKDFTIRESLRCLQPVGSH